MTVQGQLRPHTIKSPLTVNFNIQKVTDGSGNLGHFLIHNMLDIARSDIRRDPSDEFYLGLTFSAGYKSQGVKPLLFRGNIRKAFSYREGPDIVTEIEALEGLAAIQGAPIELTLNYPWTFDDAIKALAASMKLHHVQLGAIGNVIPEVKAKRGITFSGLSWSELKKLLSPKHYACIDKEKVYVMAENDALIMPGALAQINASTGLIGTPRRSANMIDFSMLFEPFISLMQRIKVKSTVVPELDGEYIVRALSHNGVISGAIDQGVTTSVSCYQAPDGIKDVKPK
jgi:hypothetical protein